MLHFRVFAAAWLAAVFGVGAWAPPFAAAGDRIVVLASRDAPPYAQALGGFRDYLKERGVDTALRVEVLEGDAAKARDVVGQVVQEGATLIFTLGSLATKTACDQIRDTPIVAGLILDGGELNGAATMLLSAEMIKIRWLHGRRIVTPSKLSPPIRHTNLFAGGGRCSRNKVNWFNGGPPSDGRCSW